MFLLGAAVALTGCVAYVRPAPPPPRRVVIGYPQGPGYVWMDGYWGWNGAAYAWVRGRWAYPPRPRAVWVPALWVLRPGGWVFVHGHWR